MATLLNPFGRLLVSLVLATSAISAHAIDWSKKLPLEHKSRYFEFHCQRETWDVAAFARFADGFVDLVNRDLVKLGFDYPIQVLVLPDRAGFQQFLKKEFVVRDPPNFGMYFPAFKVFVTFEDSGLGTFAHEITHPLLDRNLRNCPVWASEAVPAFFEKFIGYWDDDKLEVAGIELSLTKTRRFRPSPHPSPRRGEAPILSAPSPATL